MQATSMTRGERTYGSAAHPTSPYLRVQVLCEFSLFVDGRFVALSEGLQRLVAWLALEDRPRSRSMTAKTMWPERSDANGASSLRRALWRLNRDVPGLVTREGQVLGLASGTCVDLVEVQELARAAQEGTVQGTTPIVQQLAYDLLPAWPYQWLHVHRESLRQLRLHALERVAYNNLEAGRPADALAAALAAVGVEPLRESAQRTVVAIHVAEGNVGEALHQYHAYRTLLWSELRLRPGPDIEAMLPLSGPGPVRLMPRRRTP